MSVAGLLFRLTTLGGCVALASGCCCGIPKICIYGICDSAAPQSAVTAAPTTEATTTEVCDGGYGVWMPRGYIECVGENMPNGEKFVSSEGDCVSFCQTICWVSAVNYDSSVGYCACKSACNHQRPNDNFFLFQ